MEDIYSRSPLMGVSQPTNFVHQVHVGFDPITGGFTVSTLMLRANACLSGLTQNRVCHRNGPSCSRHPPSPRRKRQEIPRPSSTSCSSIPSSRWAETQATTRLRRSPPYPSTGERSHRAQHVSKVLAWQVLSRRSEIGRGKRIACGSRRRSGVERRSAVPEIERCETESCASGKHAIENVCERRNGSGRENRKRPPKGRGNVNENVPVAVQAVISLGRMISGKM